MSCFGLQFHRQRFQFRFPGVQFNRPSSTAQDKPPKFSIPPPLVFNSTVLVSHSARLVFNSAELVCISKALVGMSTVRSFETVESSG